MSNEEFAAAVQNGERDKLPELWDAVRRFAHSRARRWARALDGRGGVTVDDLMQCAFLALLDALEGWKPEGGAFLTWYGLRLRAAFTAATGQRAQRDRMDPLQHAKSLDADLDENDEEGVPFTLLDVVPDYSAEAAFADIAELDRWERLHNAVEAALQSLTEQQEAVIRARYYRGRTLREAAEEMGITAAQAQKHETAALRSLRNPRISRELFRLWR